MDFVTVLLVPHYQHVSILEFVAWFTHGHIMHAPGHGINHHTIHDHALERNDLFALCSVFLLLG
jgi:hypothetical protein